MPFEFSLFTIIIISYVFGRVARRFHLSEVIGMIIAGLLVTAPGVSNLFIQGHDELILNLGHISIVALMFFAGLEVSWSHLLKEERDAFIITAFTIVSSLFVGVLVFSLLGFHIITALIMGVCFSITAEATKARVLIQLKKLKTKVGTLLMGIGVLNDVLGVMFILVISLVFTRSVMYSDIVLLLLVLAAFAGGIWVHLTFDRFTKKIKIIEKLLLIFVIPFFFVSIGLYFNSVTGAIDYKILFIVIVTAVCGQMLGVFLSKPVTKMRLKQLFLIGWGMNSKGLVELAIAFLAFRIGLLPGNLYTALVITSIVTTIIFQIIIFRMVKKDPLIMD